jgi:hypothetical protein
MKAVLKAQLPRYLAIMAGIALGKSMWRSDHQQSALLDWPTVRGIVVGVAIVYFIYCLIIWIRHRPQNSATDSN